ncbi:MAG: hypothetical protein SR1Q7_12640, partial [Quinella sp. 1Q7]|nr:hypothetical protein [Quinella sp. 1Q7]
MQEHCAAIIIATTEYFARVGTKNPSSIGHATDLGVALFMGEFRLNVSRKEVVLMSHYFQEEIECAPI